MAVYLITTGMVLFLARYVQTRTGGAELLLPSGRLFCASLSPALAGRQRALSYTALAAIFTALLLPAALRVNIGNDYARYVEFMHLIRSNAYVPTEIGFNLFVRAIYALCGYENYLLVFALLAAATIGLFLSAIREQARFFSFSFFLFMMLGYYFQSYNTVRYYLALAAAVYAWKYLLRREYLPFVLTILLAASFHKSALVVLVLYPLALLPWGKWQLAAAALLCLVLAAFPDFWLRMVVLLYPSYAETEYLSGNGLQYGNIARCAAVVLLSVLCGRKLLAESRRARFYFYCNLGALALYVFCSYLPFLSRIGYYLTVTQIFLLPELLYALPAEKKRLKRLLAGAILLAAAAYFVFFLRQAQAQNIKLVPYQSFLFTDMPPISSEVN